MNPPATDSALRVLVVDDAPQLHADFRKILAPTAAGHSAFAAAQATLFGDSAPAAPAAAPFLVDAASQGQEALALVQRALADRRPYCVAFVDMRMPPGWDGLETIRHLWTADPALQIVICTAYSDRSWGATIRELGHTDSLLILKKPFDNIEVLQLAHALGRKWLAHRRDREILAELDARVRHRTAELKESEERFARIFHANPVATTLQQQADGRYLDANPAFLELIDRPRDQVIGHTPAGLGLWPSADVWTEAVRSLSTDYPLRSHRARLCRRDGTLRDVLLSVERTELGPQACVLSSIEDITDRILLEQQFRQAQKMEAVGQLAAGIAHDFNNLLTVVQAYTSIILDEAALTAAHRESLSQVRTATDRAAALTRQLLIFSRRQLTQPAAVDLAETLASLRAMVTRLLPARIAVEWHCAPGLPLVHADEPNLEQVVMNLVVNARDAIAGDGSIRLALRPVTLTAADATRHAEARAGQFVCLAISDTGCGMEPAILARVFEPFFTTKGVGHGTGLGLSTVYAIVRQHHGWIEVASTPGRGTAFSIFLPASQQPAAPRPAPRTTSPDLSAFRGHGERILLVEDELPVRFVARTLLERAGYQVTEAGDGPAALAIWERASTPFDLLLTDMVMPNGLSGAELAAELTRRRPGLKVLLTTGYSHELLKRSAQSLAGAHILLKPFAAAPFLAAVREALDTPA